MQGVIFLWATLISPSEKKRILKSWIALGKSLEFFGYRQEEALDAYNHAIELDKSSSEAYSIER